jgi:hypothetical protein
VESGHEDESISRNNDHETPLMLAAASAREDVGVMLAKRFPDCIPWANRAGLDAVHPIHPHRQLSLPQLTRPSSCSPASPAAVPIISSRR